eukprot:9722504-Lingulodinium_polyedra.AAC.1
MCIRDRSTFARALAGLFVVVLVVPVRFATAAYQRSCDSARGSASGGSISGFRGFRPSGLTIGGGTQY